MADPNKPGTMNDKGVNERLRSELNQAGDNQTMRAEQAKAEVSRQPQDEKAKLDKERQEQGAMGGSQSGSQTGEPGRARDELSQSQNKEKSAIGGSHPADKPEEFKKDRESATPR
jgi:hypothetical protein